MKKLTVKYNNEKRAVGYLDNQIFRKQVSGKKHLFKKTDAWGIDAEVFKYLKDKADTLKVYDTDNQKTYTVSYAVFEEKGEYLHFKPHRAQIFLPRKYWEKT